MIGQPYTSQDQASQSTRLPSRSSEYRGSKPYRRRLSSLDRLASDYKPVWNALNEFLHPWSGRRLAGDTKQRHDRLICANIRNYAVGDAARICASALHGGLTSPAKPWFELTHPDAEMMENQAVKSWMDETQRIMRSTLAKSNFYSVIPNLYLEAVIYGTAAMIIDPDPETGVRFRHLTIGEYVLGIGEDLRVNSLYRRLDISASQLREKFGEDNPGFTAAVRDALTNGNLDEPTFTVIHAIQPVGMFGGKPNKLFSHESVYFLESADDPEAQTVLAWRGHRSQPFVAVRWAATADDIYGYSPGMMSLPDDRMLQEIENDYANASEMSLKPPTTGPASLEPEIRDGQLTAGKYVPYDAAGQKPAIQPILQVNYDFANTRVKIQDAVASIQGRFYNHLFLSILFNNKQMTATEVAQRLEEKAMVLGPMLERFQAELFAPILDREFVILYHEYGIIPEPPEELAGAELKVEYIGSLAQSVRMIGLTNVSNSLPLVMEMLKIDPAAAIKINVKEVIDDIATKANWPPKGIRPDDECEEIEAAQAQAAQAAAQAEQMRNMAAPTSPTACRLAWKCSRSPRRRPSK